MSTSSTATPITSSAAPVVVRATELPEDFEFFTPENIESLQDFIIGTGRLEKNAYGGKHGEFYVKGRKTAEKPDFKLTGVSSNRFGICYQDGEHGKAVGNKLAPNWNVRDLKDSEGKKVKETGYCLAFPEWKNSCLTVWCNTMHEIGSQMFSKYGKILKEVEEDYTIQEARKMVKKCSRASMKNKDNAAKYGPHFKVKVDLDTLCVKKTPCGKKDLRTDMADLWGKEGTFDVYGQLYKLNIDAPVVGTCLGFLAKTIVFTPKATGAGKAAKHLDFAPADYVDPAIIEAQKALARQQAALAAAGIVIAPTVTAPTTDTGASKLDEPILPTPTTPGSMPNLQVATNDDMPLGAVGGKRKFDSSE